VFIASWLRNSQRINKKVSTSTVPIDANTKPMIPEEVFTNTETNVLSHHELLESIDNHLNSNNHVHSNTNVSATTTLSSPAKKGDTKLNIDNTTDFAVGMSVIIGTGSLTEIRTISGLGSIYLDSSIHHNHSKGTIIRGFRSLDDLSEVLLTSLHLIILLTLLL